MGSGSSTARSDEPDISPITVPDIVKGYKPPRPPKWKARDVFDSDDADIKGVDERASKVTITTETTFASLVSELTKGLTTDLKKVRALFIWTGHQDVKGQFYPGVTDGRTPRGYMKLMKVGKGTYADFFTLLCRAANIPCVKVHGNCKSLGYDVGDQDVTSLKGTWNAVYIDGAWQIVHPMWSFTSVVGHDSGRWTKIETEGQGTRQKAQAKTGVSVRDIDEHFFLPHPEEFLYMCIAEKKEWQLVAEPWDLYKFCNVPRFEFFYFKCPFKLKDPHKAIIYSQGGKCELLFQQKANTVLKFVYELFFDEQHSKECLPTGIELPRCVFYETAGNNLRLVVRFHVAGIYKLVVKCGLLSLNGPIASFRLEANEKSTNENMLPVNPEIGYGFGHTAKENGMTKPSHTSGVVVTKRSKVEEFSFRMKQETKVVARLRHNKLDSDELDQHVSQEVKGNELKVKVTMPDDEEVGEYALQIYQEEETAENNIINYLLTNKKEDFEKIHEEVIRKNLAIAVGQHKVEPLETAMTEFVKAKLRDTNGDLQRAKLKLQKLKKDEKRNAQVHDMKQKLHKAMAHRKIPELEQALSEVESQDYPELEGLLDRARKLLAKLDTEDINKEVASEIRTVLKNATRARNRNDLEQAIRTFQNAQLPDEGDLSKAKKTLCQLFEEDVEVRMSRNDIEALEEVLKEAEDSVVDKELLQSSEMMKRAHRFLQQQKRLKGYLSPVLALKHATVAEIQGYSKPKQITEDVMKATLLTLGENPSKLQMWKDIQKNLNPSGIILKRIKSFQINQLHSRTADRASRLLEKYSSDDVREVSAGVATFYEWSKQILHERQNSEQ